MKLLFSIYLLCLCIVHLNGQITDTKEDSHVDEMLAKPMVLTLSIIENEKAAKPHRIALKDSRVFLNGFYLNPEKLVFAAYFIEGENTFQAVLPQKNDPQQGIFQLQLLKEWLSPAYPDRVLRAPIEKGKDVYTFLTTVKKMSFHPRWHKAKTWQKLEKQDALKIENITRSYVSAYRSDDLNAIANAEKQYRSVYYLDWATVLHQSHNKWEKAFFEILFHEENRKSFHTANEYEIELSKTNPKVINVIGKNNAPVFSIISKTPQNIFREDGEEVIYMEYSEPILNFIYIDGQWKIY